MLTLLIGLTKNIALSANFTLWEFLRSNTAEKEDILDEQFKFDKEVSLNLQKLCTYILQPLREAIGPIRMNSGYRCLTLNRLIGSRDTSDHPQGKAGDIEGVRVRNSELFYKIVDMNLPFKQLIWEFGDSKDPDWIHVSYEEEGPHRRQILRAMKENGRTVYKEYKGKLNVHSLAQWINQ